MKRRSFLRSVGSLPLLGMVQSGNAEASTPSVFQHGVASGDPAPDSVVLWTRLTVPSAQTSVQCEWSVAEDAQFQRIVSRGTATTGAHRDHTINVNAGGLQPGREYFYRFLSGVAISPVGRTRTLPTGSPASLQFAVVSCSNHPAGYFNAYRDIAAQPALDAVIHLGDYIYEYGSNGYAAERAQALGRMPSPDRKLETLADYRARHAQYKSDPDLQALHAAVPMIATWDDHEFLNNSWHGGSEGYSDSKLAWREQRRAAVQAYREWLPIRMTDAAPDRIFRSFEFGDLLTLLVLDTRHYGRDQQLSYLTDLGTDLAAFHAKRNDPARSMLGAEQERWLETQLRASRAQWQVLAQQTPVCHVLLPKELQRIVDRTRSSRFAPATLAKYLELSDLELPLVLDTWDGYAGARTRLLSTLKQSAKNPLILTGDIHTSMACQLRLERDGDIEAVEFVTPPVTSPGLDEYFPAAPGACGAAFMRTNPDMLYFDGTHRGWLHLQLQRDACRAQWRFVDTVFSKSYATSIGATTVVEARDNQRGYRVTHQV